MGHGWQNHFNNNVLRNVEADGRGNVGPTDTVVKRRKNRSSCEEGKKFIGIFGDNFLIDNFQFADIGSLLLCNPSVNLRSLVPKEVLDMTTNHLDDNKGKIVPEIYFFRCFDNFSSDPQKSNPLFSPKCR